MFIHEDYKDFFPHMDGKFPVKYPSITKILSTTQDRSGLDEWIKRVGEEEAKRISKESTEFGNSLHELIENHFLHPDRETQEIPPGRLRFTFESLLAKLKGKNIVPIGIEVPLQSHILGVQGRVDFIAIVDGELFVIDWKTSKKMKNRAWISDYFKQATTYALCFKEMTGTPIKKVSIVICGELFCQWEEANVKDWILPLKESFYEYNKLG